MFNMIHVAHSDSNNLLTPACMYVHTNVLRMKYATQTKYRVYRNEVSKGIIYFLTLFLPRFQEYVVIKLYTLDMV